MNGHSTIGLLQIHRAAAPSRQGGHGGGFGPLADKLVDIPVSSNRVIATILAVFFTVSPSLAVKSSGGCEWTIRESERRYGSRNREKMKILSARDDFEQISLAGFSGVLEKLWYLASLRTREGGYMHWGLAKVYSRQTATEAIAAAHSRAFSQLLSSPLEQLAVEVASASGGRQISAGDYVETLCADWERIKPQVTKCGWARHSDAVLLALSKLARTDRSAGHQAA